MLLNVAQLLREGVGATRFYRLRRESLKLSGFGSLEELNMVVRLARTNRGILMQAEVAALSASACSRCLVEFRQPITAEIEEECFPSVDVFSGKKCPAPEDPTAFVISPQHTIDLEEVLREYTSLSLPMQPLCSPECAGLCPQCGADLNVSPCSCARREEDVRPAGLAQQLSALEDTIT